MDTLAYNIKRYSNIRNLTNGEIASKLGVSSATVSYWKNGRKIPTFTHIDQLCYLFNCSRSDLLDNPPKKVNERVLIKEFKKANKETKLAILRLLKLEDVS